MDFRSISDLENYLLSKCKEAVNLMQASAFQVIEGFIKQYYAEYEPVMYERTYQLFKSLVKSEIRPTANGWEADVYFDLERLDYHVKKINGVLYDNKGWSEQKTLSSAAHGHHGGKYAGTAIWDEPMIVLTKHQRSILKNALLNAGIPVR